MNRLKELREDKDIIQKDIAKILGITQTGYSKYEVETNDIPTDVLKKRRNKCWIIQLEDAKDFFVFHTL